MKIYLTMLFTAWLTAPLQVTANQVEISGLIQSDGYSGAGSNAVPVDVTLIASSVAGGVTNYLQTNIISGVMFTNNASLTGGFVQFVQLSVPESITHLSAKTPWTLRSKVAVTNGAFDFTDNTGNKLLGGDITASTGTDPQDNVVNTDDFFKLIDFFYLTDAEAGTTVADITGDGVVDGSDFDALADGYELQGSEP